MFFFRLLLKMIEAYNLLVALKFTFIHAGLKLVIGLFVTMSNSENQQPQCMHERNGNVPRLKNNIKELSKLLAFCYETWWRRMEPQISAESDFPPLVITNEGIAEPIFTCVYCNDHWKTVNNLTTHIRKSHYQLYKARPVVVLERMGIPEEDVMPQPEEGSEKPEEPDEDVESQPEVNLEKLEGPVDVATSPPRKKPCRKRSCHSFDTKELYHCFDCNQSSPSRQEIKVHIFTRHLYKKLYVRANLKYASEMSLRYFSKMTADFQCRSPTNQFRVRSVRNHTVCWRWLTRIRDELDENKRLATSSLFICPCCRLEWQSLEHLAHHMHRIHQQILSYPVINLEDVQVRHEEWPSSPLPPSPLLPSSPLPSPPLPSSPQPSPQPSPPLPSPPLLSPPLPSYVPAESVGKLSHNDTTDLGYCTGPLTHSPYDESTSTQKKIYSWLKDVSKERRTYCCSECSFSIESRRKIKIHIFTRHIYKKLYEGYQPSHPKSERENKFEDKLSDEMRAYYCAMWKCEIVMPEGYDECPEEESFECFYCGISWEALRPLKRHIIRTHKQLYKYKPVVKLKRLNPDRINMRQTVFPEDYPPF